MIKWMESGTLFQTKPWLGELPTSSPSVSNMAGQSRNKMEVSCCETWEDGPESHGWLPEGIHAYPFWGVQESQATRLILDASLLCLSKVSGHRKKMMELQYNSFPQQIKILPSNPSLGGGHARSRVRLALKHQLHLLHTWDRPLAPTGIPRDILLLQQF